MSEKIKASISALIDEEISTLEVHRLLRQFDEHQELKTSWIRYLQIRAVSQGDHPLTTQQHLNLHSRISRAIADEAVYDGSAVITSPARSFRTSADNWYKPLAGFAVAAALVIAVYIGLESNSGIISTEIADSHPSSAASTAAQTQAAEASAPLQVSTVSVPVPSDALKADKGAGSLAVNMPEAVRALSPGAQEKFRQYLRRHEWMNRRNINQNLHTVKFNQATPPASRKESD